MRKRKIINFRRLYPYICKGCHKSRGTKVYVRRIGELCTLCKREEIDKNQLSMLED